MTPGEALQVTVGGQGEDGDFSGGGGGGGGWGGGGNDSTDLGALGEDATFGTGLINPVLAGTICP